MRKHITIAVLVVLFASIMLTPATSAADRTGLQTADQVAQTAGSRFNPQALDLAACEELAFSTEEDFVTQGPEPPDGNPIISDGDLLGTGCTVCARNSDLVAAVFDTGADRNLGLDAADVIDVDGGLVAFSTELDSPNAGQFTAGDLLATNGTVIPNIALTNGFDIGYDIGLDGVHFVGDKTDIIAFLAEAAPISRGDWLGNPELLAPMLATYGVDIWFSTEGTAPMVTNPAFLDGDILSASSGTIIARNADVLPTTVPAGIPNRGVDFGVDAVTSSRFRSKPNIRFSTEILYEGEASFTDGDILEYSTGLVLKTNQDLVACFEPRARFLGLDALHMKVESVQDDTPHITDIGHVSTGDINGGSVLAEGPGTGLANVLGYDRPFGNWIPINGHIPTGIYEFRVAYRLAGTSRPASPDLADGIAVIPGVGWHADMWDGSACGNIWVPYASDGDGWFNAADYLTLKGDSCSSNLALTVWDSTDAGNPDGHYVIWLQWRNTMGGPIIEEAYDHHVQLDNKAPENLAVDIPGGACTEFTTATMPVTPTAHFDDAHFWRYRLRIFGGNPPSAYWYATTPYDADPDIGPAGTGPGFADLHPVDVADLPVTPVDCCYGIRLWVEDRTILGYFHASVDLHPWGYGHEDSLEVTFSYNAP